MNTILLTSFTDCKYLLLDISYKNTLTRQWHWDVIKSTARGGGVFIVPFQCICDLQCTEASIVGLNHFTYSTKSHSSCHFV
jgi:hypothetical protein